MLDAPPTAAQLVTRLAALREKPVFDANHDPDCGCRWDYGPEAMPCRKHNVEGLTLDAFRSLMAAASPATRDALTAEQIHELQGVLGVAERLFAEDFELAY